MILDVSAASRKGFDGVIFDKGYNLYSPYASYKLIDNDGFFNMTMDKTLRLESNVPTTFQNMSMGKVSILLNVDVARFSKLVFRKIGGESVELVVTAFYEAMSGGPYTSEITENFTPDGICSCDITNLIKPNLTDIRIDLELWIMYGYVDPISYWEIDKIWFE